MSENMQEHTNYQSNELNCDKKDETYCKNCNYCFTSTEASIHSRRCFMTGEHCSKQSNIQRERKKLHDKNQITAFVIMNFSDMSNVVYKWRLRTFIESLSKYLYFSKEKSRLYCSISAHNENWSEKDKIKEIHVIRSDSDPASNYVICSRICQQMQIADLIIVDVSSQNANVFYEFGMAVALGKMILPICYCESFFKMTIPQELRKKYWEWDENTRNSNELHIGFYPWRKTLFEYYGIRYKEQQKNTDKDSIIQYLPFNEIVQPELGFSDIKYNRFPYHEFLDDPKYENKIGEIIYDKLLEEYNTASEKDNTLVVYTMDAFLNEEEAGLCIVNFYHNITSRMRQEKCFCGDRVGVLVQENVILENEKDSKEQLDLFYNVGEIIQIGVNQATYLAAEEKIKANDDFTNSAASESERLPELQREDVDRFVKGYVKNRAMRIYPNNPVFVDRMKTLLHKDLLEPAKPVVGQVCNCSNLNSFCLYHVMIRTLRYTNEIVVDISNNNLQSLFWLGAAHASDIYAITVMHEKTDIEKANTEKENLEETGLGKTSHVDLRKKENRYVFDVAGLWMAIFRKNDTDGFYQQLASAQNGIERHSKLMLPDSRLYKKQMRDFLFSFDKNINKCNGDKVEPESVYKQKAIEEADILESYYRNHFWAPMLSYNQLSLYISQRDDVDKEKEPKLSTARWDFDAISVLSHYLSKRKVIGEYFLKSQPEEKGAESANFICLGSFSKPELPEYIYKQIKEEPVYNIIHQKLQYISTVSCNDSIPEEIVSKGNSNNSEPGKCYFKGFECIGEEKKVIFTHHPKIKHCTSCKKIDNNPDSVEPQILYSTKDADKYTCSLRKNSTHYEIAQLILWREDPKNLHEHSYFWVGIIGCSGPATNALSTIFVDKEQRSASFNSDNVSDEDICSENYDDNLLCELQSNIRNKFMGVFFEKLWEEVDKMSLKSQKKNELSSAQKRKYFDFVRYAIASYLQTVLYRYFFPFLSEKEINRIYNGIYTFVNSMKSAKVGPFDVNCFYSGINGFTDISNDSIDNITEKIPNILLSVLKSFKGLEAFYKVEVNHLLSSKQDSLKDTRTLRNIKMLDGDIPNINYFFIEKK